MALTDYTPTDWQNGEAGGTPLDSDHLNKIESGISEVTQAVATSQTVQNTVVDISDQVTKLTTASNVHCSVLLVNGNEISVTISWDNATPDADTLTEYISRGPFQLPENVRPLVLDRKQIRFDNFPTANVLVWLTPDGRIGLTARALGSASTITLAGAGEVVLRSPVNTSLL